MFATVALVLVSLSLWTASESRSAQLGSGYVVIENRTAKPISIVGESYLDSMGIRRSLEGVSWQLKPKERRFLKNQDNWINARQFYYRLYDWYGQSRWTNDMGDNDDGGHFLIIIADWTIDRHVETRRQAIANAVGKLGAAALAQSAVTSGDADKDGALDMLFRGLALVTKEALIYGATEDVFWFATEATKATVRRVARLVVEGRLTFQEYRQASRRDAFFEFLKREAPALAEFADFFEFMDRLREASARPAGR